MMNRKLDARALLLHRKARKKGFKAPQWGDHVLNGVRMFTTAGRLQVK
jgi:hypothetical protein